MRELRLTSRVVREIIGSSPQNLYAQICLKCMTLYGTSEQTHHVLLLRCWTIERYLQYLKKKKVTSDRANRRKENTKTSLRVATANQNRRQAKRGDDVNWADGGAKTGCICVVSNFIFVAILYQNLKLHYVSLHLNSQQNTGEPYKLTA